MTHPGLLAYGGPNATSWQQVVYLVVAAVLGAALGYERELRGKSAGIRTNAVIGLAAALVMEVSKAGFGDVAGHNVTLDPSRVAAQVVSGIGFVGAGIIFVQGHSVRGLTTASTAWMAAAIGLACGAGLLALAAIVTVLHVGIVVGLTRFERPRKEQELTACFDAPDPHTPAAAAAACARAGVEVAEVRGDPSAGGNRASIVCSSGELAALYDVLAAVPGVQRLDVSVAGNGSRAR